MELESWMLDGGICLIILFSAILGAAKGFGDTILRLLGIGGGVALGLFYSDRVSLYLQSTAFCARVHDKVFTMLRGAGVGDQKTVGTSSAFGGVSDQVAQDPYESALPRIISFKANDLADKAANEAADRLTSMIMGVLGFVAIVLAVWLAVTILRFLIRRLRDTSFVIGFADRVAGFALGTVKGLVVACIAAMLIVPVTTIFDPDAVPALLKVMDETTIASVIYDVNPLLYLIKALL